VVHGNDGMDEISISAPTKVMELNRGDIREYMISPEDFGVSAVSVESIRGGDAAENAATIEALFRGESGPKRDVVLMNAAAAIVAGGAAQSLREGFLL